MPGSTAAEPPPVLGVATGVDCRGVCPDPQSDHHEEDEEEPAHGDIVAVPTDPAISPSAPRVYTTLLIMYMKTVIDIDEAALAAAAKELGTTTKEDTGHAALAFVAARSERIASLTDGPLRFGADPDIDNPEVRAAARR